MVYGYFDIVEFDVGGAGCGTVGGFYGGDFYTFAFGYENDGEALFGAAGGYEVWDASGKVVSRVVGRGRTIREHAVCDPFFCTVDYVVFSIWSFLCESGLVNFPRSP